ncbi:MAG: toll/interleukin-1 receptor domain-containing protein [Oscillospiraceae bacterium]|nr:toll/interleukin-1 receptor domain-containing protein [Oscillospiraceae bacterium]
MNGLKPYQGNEPYLFISYAHADEQAVGSVLEHLEQNGVRFWYDDGIEAGSEWPEYIAERLASANMMIAFVSNAYAVSDNCRKEMHYAVSNKIKTINVFLEDADLTPGMTLQIGNIFALMKYRMEEREFYDRLDQALQIPGETGQDEKSGKRLRANQGRPRTGRTKRRSEIS